MFSIPQRLPAAGRRLQAGFYFSRRSGGSNLSCGTLNQSCLAPVALLT